MDDHRTVGSLLTSWAAPRHDLRLPADRPRIRDGKVQIP